jgi:uncharacterized membrane protein
MKKEEKKYTVIRHYTKDNIVNIGYNKWIGNNMWLLFVVSIIAIGAQVLINEYVGKNSFWSYLVLIPYLAIIGYGFWRAMKYGVKLFDKIKDLPEPIDWDDIKESK